jgi:hypothetical protein
MKEMSREYYTSLKLLNKRISELQKEKSEIELNRARLNASANAAHREKNKDRYNKIAIQILVCDSNLAINKDRLKPLVNMKFDLVDVAREVYHYYDLFWYRSPDYSMNKRKGQRFIYSEPRYKEKDEILPELQR